MAPASVTGIVDRLERKGFVERLPRPDTPATEPGNDIERGVALYRLGTR